MRSRTTSKRSGSVRTDPNLPFEQEYRNPDVLSADEIRYWIRELAKNPHWGWARNKANLGRALGFKNPKANESMMSKLRGAWIYPTEQVRLSVRIRMILNGHLVPDYNAKPNTFVYANPARPLVPPPAKLTVTTAATGPRLTVQQFTAPVAQLPDFKSVFKNARLWKTD